MMASTAIWEQVNGMRNKLKNILFSIAAVLFWIIVWYVVAYFANKSLIIGIPTPHETIGIFMEKCGQASFWNAVGSSVLHIVLGFAGGLIAGALGGILSSHFEFFRILSSPLIHLVRSVPVAAFIIIAWLWVPSAILPSVISGLMVLPIVWSHTDAGLRSIDKKLPEMGKVYGLGGFDILWKIKLPLLTPHLRTGCITGVGIAWKSGVAAEVICNTKDSIGSILQKSKNIAEYGEVFAITLMIILLSLILENVLKVVWREKKYDIH